MENFNTVENKTNITHKGIIKKGNEKKRFLEGVG